MKRFSLLFIVLIVCGCSHAKQSELIQHSYLKNYSIGEIKTAYIGQPIVKARDYYTDNKVSYDMKASSDFVLTGIYQKKIFDYNVKIQGKGGMNYPSSGSINIDDIAYTIVNLKNEVSNKKEEIGILVDKNGAIYRGYIVDDDHDVKMKLIKTDDAHINITMAKGSLSNLMDENSIELFACYTNYELIYGGINNVTLSMTYREFTIDDLARPSFFQNVVYETTAKQIRFKDTTLDVIEATNEKIVYKVMSDGLVAKTFEKDTPPKDYNDCKNSYVRINKSRNR